MHFVTWDLPDPDLHRCFEIFSCGRSMADRAIEFRTLCRKGVTQMSENDAVECLQSGLHAYACFSDRPELRAEIQFFRGTRDQIQTEIGYTENLWELVEAVSQHPLVAEISDFLVETLYRLASSYQVAEYILWPLFADPKSINPHRHFAMLELTHRYQAQLGEDGPILFIQTDSGITNECLTSRAH